jgi:hypothetical protein
VLSDLKDKNPGAATNPSTEVLDQAFLKDTDQKKEEFDLAEEGSCGSNGPCVTLRAYRPGITLRLQLPDGNKVLMK